MSKADKRKKRAKRKAADIGLPELAPTQKRDAKRCFVDRTRQQTEDPRKTALQARVMRFGGEDTLKGRIALSGQHSGSQIGLVMQATLKPHEIAPLWQTFQTWCVVEATYRRRYLGQADTPKGATIMTPPEPMETDKSHSVDLRDPEQKDRDAVNRWMQWQGYLGHLSAAYQRVLHDARLERADLWRYQRPTQRGLNAVEALQALHVVVEGKQTATAC